MGPQLQHPGGILGERVQGSLGSPDFLPPSSSQLQGEPELQGPSTETPALTERRSQAPAISVRHIRACLNRLEG